ncbi:MAG TPA: hypothetical protein VE987_15735 [Polyangiaceae bacterium]|nr:hypothetical protein [Polyangiaceae bacterium]
MHTDQTTTDKLRATARSVGLDPDEAIDTMSFPEFCLAVGARRAASDAQRIALAVIRRRTVLR